MSIIEIINIAAIIIIPIVSVVIGQYLQNRSEKRKDKVDVFKTLMTYRNSGYTDSKCVNALNMIPILFIKDKKVMQAYSEFVILMNTTDKNKDAEKQITIKKVKLLQPGTCIAFGSGFKLTSLIKIDMPDPSPSSSSCDISSIWFLDRK